MIWATLSTLLSHWRRRPGQLAALVLGLMLATGLWSGVQAINAEARASYDRAAEMLGQGSIPRLVSVDGGGIPISALADLRRQGIPASPVLEGVLRSPGARLTLTGIDPLSIPEAALPPALRGAGLPLAGVTGPEGVLLMASETADGPLPPDLPPIVLSDAVPPGTALTDIATAAQLLERTNASYLLLEPGLRLDSAVSGLHLQSPDQAADLSRLTGSFHLNLTAFGLLSFAVGLFISHSAIGLAFEQRRPVIRTLRSLGLPLSRLVWAMLLELAGIALFAGAAGIALGYAIAAALLPGVAGTLRGLYGAPVSGELGFDPVWALSGLGITAFGAGLAATGALWRIARMPILAPAQPRAWAMASGRGMRRQLSASLLLASVSALAAAFGSGLVAGFLCLGALLLSAALALPALLAGALSVLSPITRSPFAEWALADTRQQLPGLSLALMALMLALAANIGVSTMVGSFRATFTGWLDQRLASELYVTTATPEEARALQAFLAPRADAILPIVSAEVPLEGAPGTVFGVADHPTYRDHWPILDGVEGLWDRLAAGDGVLANEQLARREGLSPGDMIEVGPAGRLPILGIYSDYGNPLGQALLGLEAFRAAFPSAPELRFAIRTDDAERLMRAITGEFGLPQTAISDQAAVKALSLRVFDQTFRVTGALNVLTLGVAALALLASLLTLAALRLPQLAPVWAMGETRARLAKVELLRSLGLAALTFLAALPVGLALAWVLLAIVNVEAFGWRLPMRLFPVDYLRLGLYALTAAGIAAALPAIGLARMPPARLLQVFASDR